MGGGSWINMRAFDWNTGQTILIVLLVMVGSFYSETLFGKNPSLYVPQQEQQQLEKQQQLSIASNSSSLEFTSGNLCCSVVEVMFCLANDRKRKAFRIAFKK
ncbi:hypothetical protein MTR67_017392 [Solanum verrucosum]|uniref:Uncharacterized protein n=1 Tax=Solanum verrucosum TaxID=315347 RepID=A0AAF0TKQ9_SOLVR|nr:hypothetical protein MTR67_017392 [Solanum verrucosum]